ncbi:hypothetical protein, conserved [Trypanosoma brucei brucei TREU927]|uniref:Uncharacterized protein n=1 Tax=Trypanosoma brucei brucei (strain 927/4 GUTat10.1) TaxID=185431 RepID=Q57V51_TRYB2|nr:hypothetical protein, conserved [Trypanosoma brucei brucei TREU927]AAX70517.1 hypothetical protein, conserved [Trypanosoma brucei]AAZ10369.1 hypothetical protein, conserved [Trypanosoma brucei brucei TREU927]
MFSSLVLVSVAIYKLYFPWYVLLRIFDTLRYPFFPRGLPRTCMAPFHYYCHHFFSLYVPGRRNIQMGDCFDEGCEKASSALRSFEKRVLSALEAPLPECLMRSELNDRVTYGGVADEWDSWCQRDPRGVGCSKLGADAHAGAAEGEGSHNASGLATSDAAAGRDLRNPTERLTSALARDGGVQRLPLQSKQGELLGMPMDQRGGGQVLLSNRGSVGGNGKCTPAWLRCNVGEGHVGKCGSHHLAGIATADARLEDVAMYNMCAQLSLRGENVQTKAGASAVFVGEGAAVLNRERQGHSFAGRAPRTEGSVWGLRAPLSHGSDRSLALACQHVDPDPIGLGPRRCRSAPHFNEHSLYLNRDLTEYSPWSQTMYHEGNLGRFGRRDAYSRERFRQRTRVSDSRSVVARCQKWKDQREAKLNELRVLQEENQLKDCTFKPGRPLAGSGTSHVPKVFSDKDAPRGGRMRTMQSRGSRWRPQHDGSLQRCETSLFLGRASESQTSGFNSLDEGSPFPPRRHVRRAGWPLASQGCARSERERQLKLSGHSSHSLCDFSVFERIYNRVCNPEGAGSCCGAESPPTGSACR